MAVITALAFAGWLGTAVAKGAFSRDDGSQAQSVSERTNTMTSTDERVFDFADKLTDSQEEELREMIADAEKKTACDIVLVVIDETLADYQPTGDQSVPMDVPEDWIRAYADDFWDNNYFGYDTGVEGDGILLVDDWFREPADGKMHTWISTSGRAYAELSSGDIDQILDEVYDYIEKDPCKAYAAYIDGFCGIMTGSGAGGAKGPITIGWYTIILPAVFAALLFLIFWKRRKGSVNVNERTYVSKEPDSVRMIQKSDIFLNKRVTRHKIEKNNKGGGFGGGHISSGGMSHGGGGHSR